MGLPRLMVGTDSVARLFGDSDEKVAWILVLVKLGT